jgi:CoA:oxalate CoA-transferase
LSGTTSRHWTPPEPTRPPLTGLRVLDLSIFTPGSFATQTLADLGATVLKVERPGTGDLARSTIPAYFRALNRGKGSIALDLKDRGDREVLISLVRDADVFLEAFRPGAMDRLGVGFDDVAPQAPELIYVSISPYGGSGSVTKMAGHEDQMLAAAGLLRGEDGTARNIPSVPITDIAAGLYAVVALLAQLTRRRCSATHVEVPLLAAALGFGLQRLLRDMDAARDGWSEAASEVGSGIFEVAGGEYISLSAAEPRTWRALVDALDAPPELTALDAESFAERSRSAREANRAIARLLRGLTLVDALERLHAMDVPAVRVNRPSEVLADPLVQALGMFGDTYADGMGSPIRGIATGRHSRLPDLNEHGDVVRSDGWNGVERTLTER